jgi:hypothetical protein
MSLQSEIVEFLRGERKPMQRQALCVAIQKEATHNPAWAKASIEQWDKALAAAVKAGELVLGGGTGDVVRLAVKPLEVKHNQMELF